MGETEGGRVGLKEIFYLFYTFWAEVMEEWKSFWLSYHLYLDKSSRLRVKIRYIRFEIWGLNWPLIGCAPCLRPRGLQMVLQAHTCFTVGGTTCKGWGMVLDTQQEFISWLWHLLTVWLWASSLVFWETGHNDSVYYLGCFWGLTALMSIGCWILWETYEILGT